MQLSRNISLLSKPRPTRYALVNLGRRDVFVLSVLILQLYPYPCIRISGRINISRLPASAEFLKLGKEREGAVFLDIGCCCMYCFHLLLPVPYPLTALFDSRKRCQKGYRRWMAYAECDSVGLETRYVIAGCADTESTLRNRNAHALNIYHHRLLGPRTQAI
jgi:hypothetical protein